MLQNQEPKPRPGLAHQPGLFNQTICIRRRFYILHGQPVRELLKRLVETQVERHASRKREHEGAFRAITGDYEQCLDGFEAVERFVLNHDIDPLLELGLQQLR